MKGRRKKKAASSLWRAMHFISLAQRAVGAPEQTHCRMFNQQVVASNGIISAGHPIAEDIQCCPHSKTLTDALASLSDATFVLSIIENNRLAIKSEQFEAIVHCISPAELPSVGADPAAYLVDARLVKAMDIAGTLVSEGATKVVNASIQIRNGSVVSSNGNLIIEAWHGCNMPDLLIAPKALCTAADKASSAQSKSLYRFGFTPDSLTLHYEDGAWLKSQLYDSKTELPDLMKWLNTPAKPSAIPDNFFTVVERLEPFSEDGQIHFTSDGARVVKNSFATYANDAAKGIPVGICLSIKSLLTIKPYVDKVHFNAAPGVSIFYGDMVRAAIATTKVA